MSNLYLEKLPEEYLFNYVELSSTNDNSYKYFNSIITAYLSILSASILLIPLIRLYYSFFFYHSWIWSLLLGVQRRVWKVSASKKGLEG